MSGKMLLPLLLLGFAAADQASNAEAWPQWQYKTETFTAPKFGKLRHDSKTAPGYLFLGIENSEVKKTSSSALLYENSGDVVWHGASDNWLTYNFRKQMLNGEPVLTYWTAEVGGHDRFGHGYGEIIILDNQYRQKYNICLTDRDINIVTPNPKAFPGNRRHPCLLDSHESYITDRGTIMATVFNVTRRDLTQLKGPKDGWIFDGIIYEIDIATQKILWQWNALDHIDITTSNFINRTGDTPLFIGDKLRGHSQEEPWDFFHMNSVQSVPGGYIANSRMTWSFYKINGSSGNVEWTMEGSHGGNLTLDPGIFWSWSHDVRMDTSQGSNKFQIHMFNNDNGPSRLANGVNASSGYLLEVDLAKKHVTAKRKLKDPKELLYVGAQGGYHALPDGHVVLGYGVSPVVKEFDTNDKCIFSAHFAPAKHHRWTISYRAYRYPWSAKPHYPPKVAEQHGKVYMSWNGATGDVFDGWNLYVGSSKKSLKKMSVAKKGFETVKDVGKKYSHIIAEATYQGKGVANSTKITKVSGSTLLSVPVVALFATVLAVSVVVVS